MRWPAPNTVGISSQVISTDPSLLAAYLLGGGTHLSKEFPIVGGYLFYAGVTFLAGDFDHIIATRGVKRKHIDLVHAPPILPKPPSTTPPCDCALAICS